MQGHAGGHLRRLTEHSKSAEQSVAISSHKRCLAFVELQSKRALASSPDGSCTSISVAEPLRAAPALHLPCLRPSVAVSRKLPFESRPLTTFLRKAPLAQCTGHAPTDWRRVRNLIEGSETIPVDPSNRAATFDWRYSSKITVKPRCRHALSMSFLMPILSTSISSGKQSSNRKVERSGSHWLSESTARRRCDQ
jgi:hypothetical protein